MYVNREELAWASGLFEGEGSMGYYPTSGSRGQLQMQMSMTDEDPIRRFAQAVGVGRVSGPYRNKPKDKQLWRWAAWRHEEIQAAVAMLWGGLGRRRKEQAKKSLSAHCSARTSRCS